MNNIYLNKDSFIKHHQIEFKNQRINDYKEIYGILKSKLKPKTNLFYDLFEILNNLGIKARYTGRLDEETINKMQKVGQVTFFNALWNARIAWLQDIPAFKTFGNGWVNRINNFKQKFYPA